MIPKGGGMSTERALRAIADAIRDLAEAYREGNEVDYAALAQLPAYGSQLPEASRASEPREANTGEEEQ